MPSRHPRKPTRRTFLERSAAAAAVGLGGYWAGGCHRVAKTTGKKVIIIGIDGMDPRLCDSMMKEGLLPNLTKLRAAGTFSSLMTSIPPQSPVAWANFINGADPGSHGIFDFFHRHPYEETKMFYAGSEVLPGEGGWEVGNYKLPLEFWPFNHKSPTPVLKRQGVPFWEYLDAAGVPTTFYDLPSNYPPSPSQHGHHRCICGMGTPDVFGAYGVYQQYYERRPDGIPEKGVALETKLSFDRETAKSKLVGPSNSFLKEPKAIEVDLLLHRDRQANAAVIEIPDQDIKIILKPGQWSKWTKVDFEISLPWFLPNKSASGICRFYLQEVAPNFRLYVTPINIDPSDPVAQISEPNSFVKDVSERLGLFYTTGFQEEYNARKDGFFDDDEYLRQANMVLEERLALFEYAVDDYDDGLLFFYFSSSDLQSHIFWWNSEDKHPMRSEDEAKKYFGCVKKLYQKLDAVIGDVADRYGSRASIIVMSDHGFANWGMQFNLNSWLRDIGYLNPRECTSILGNVDWSVTFAYGLGLNGLYLNLKGREPHGIVEPGQEQEERLQDLTERLEAVTDANGEPVIRNVYRADKVYSGPATELAPDLIVGYKRGYRTSWESSIGGLTEEIFSPNDNAWSADHCIDALEVPGILFANRGLRAQDPALVDIAPSILAEFGLPTPAGMTGRNVFST
ncbi:MAG TPA: alkaline phosphatase family protein [Gemmataceae bacterium]|nr:alkaline phosphatase family protein [Gemmataceae bacterium]